MPSEPGPDELPEAATVVEGRKRVASSGTIKLPPTPPAGTASGASLARSSATSAVSDAERFAKTLRDAELARTRRVLPFVIGLAVLALVAVELVGGDPIASRVMQAASVIAIVAISYLAWLASDAARFTEGRVALAYSGAVIAVTAGVFYWGIFSPAAALVGLAIFFVTLGRSQRVAIMLYALSAGVHAALAVAVLGGWLRDHGLVVPDHPDLHDQIVQQLMLQAIYLTTYLTGRATRGQLDKAVGDHDQAVRQLAQREALLAEARQDLDNALKAGGLGRYSDQVVGSYRLGGVLGRGAMGEVYEAVHTETGDPAAVKLLSAAAMAMPGQLTRFYREAEAVAKLASAHIVRLLEVSGASDAIPYLAMERLGG
ncbi:MAG: protein kinase domain-containing protein, partial [Acidobacteriota bacterium]